MAVLKCKMCGGDMNISPDKTFGTCEYCGSTMTLPKIDDEQRADAFNRGNHFRRIGEFDKALSVYEHIVEENPNDAEAHWCCALCRFGIEWVEDPVTMEYLPTCHRASFDIFTKDVDYLAAVELSDGITQKQYKKDATKISEVQKGILATSQSEKPFDVFICYKESDESGNRTVDSTLAQDIYYQLKDQGLRVFFARITLEDKIGSEYEPYIFAALNSAKVMIVVGTKPEYFNAVWVKNEWSRFLSIVKHDRSKAILPCYKDMDPYDLPEQLSVLQSYDMSKIGFIQDLVRGINKVVSAGKKETKTETVVINNGGANTSPLLKRAFMFLEDKNWREADEYCEKVLDLDPENAEAYLGKLMAELQVSKQVDLASQKEPFNKNNNYLKAVKFGDISFKKQLSGYVKFINERNEKNRLTEIYNTTLNKMVHARSENDYNNTAQAFSSILNFKDSKVMAEKCRKKADELKQERLKREEAERIERDRIAEENRAKSKKRKNLIKKVALIGMPSICVVIATIILLIRVVVPKGIYKKATVLYNKGEIEQSMHLYSSILDYSDSGEKFYNYLTNNTLFFKRSETENGATENFYVKIENGHIYGESNYGTTPQFNQESESNTSVLNGAPLKFNGKIIYFTLEGHNVSLSFHKNGFFAKDITYDDGEEFWFWKGYFEKTIIEQ